MKTSISLLLTLFALPGWLSAAPVTGASEGPAGEMVPWYPKPADPWVEALAVGNGRLGAMVFGKTDQERLQLNDITVWSGKPEPNTDRPEAYKALPEIRRLLNEQKYPEAERLTKERMTNQGGGFEGVYNGSYQTLGDLWFKFAAPAGEVTDYRRWLDLDRAVAGVEYKTGGVAFRRETFSSVPDQVAHVPLRPAA